MENKTIIQHQSVPVVSSFGDFTYNLEKILGLYTPGILNDLETDPASVVGFLENLGGDHELILFNIIEHGELLRLQGKKAKVKQYLLGNPMIAVKMTQHDLRAGLYAPLRILVYEDQNKTTVVEYDVPSSQFGQFGNDQITAIAQTLDRKLLKLINQADTE
jgi:uncharacterized protein (DUF302 family)